MPVPVKPPDERPRPGARRRQGRPALISREVVLTAALRLVDDRGLEELTMRKLGAELGVDPMTIYHHVPDKSALFDGLVERVYAEVTLPTPTGRWDDDLRALARAARTTFLAHPHVVLLLGTRPPITEPAFALVEAVTSILLTAGFTEEQAADGFDCAGRLVIGHALAEAGRPPGGEVSGGEDEHVQAERALSAERYPSLAAIGQAQVHYDPERLFNLALDGLTLALESQLRVGDPGLEPGTSSLSEKRSNRLS
jgi:TetR/AcrR family tetracycline transcriptional repressor